MNPLRPIINLIRQIKFNNGKQRIYFYIIRHDRLFFNLFKKTFNIQLYTHQFIETVITN